MATSREGPNPLRPYYIPPSIGIPEEASSKPGIGSYSTGNRNGTNSTYAYSARDIFSDIDYSDYVSDSSQSTLDTIKELLDQALYKYFSLLLAQPFDVAKTLLQVRNQASGDGSIPIDVTTETRSQSAQYRDVPEYASDDSDPDEPAYFTSSAPSSTSYSPSRSRRRHVTDRGGYVLPSSSSPAPHQLVLKRSDSILEVLSQLWSKEGAWGVWKGTNATFVYSVLLKTVESWSRSFLSAIVNLPDPGMIAGLGMAADVVDSPYPWSSLGVAVAAAAMAGIILAPLDIVRTKLIITSTTTPKRGIRHDLKQLPSYICPSSIFMPTLLHSIISPVITHGTPLILRSNFSIDRVLTPTTYSVASFFSSVAELFVKLPLETVLRRGQMSVLSSPSHLSGKKALETVVDVGAYRGVIGTMWLIAREEGVPSEKEDSPVSAPRSVKKGKKLRDVKGQGIEGLWRGWRVGMWGLVGVWGAAALGGGGSGGEF